MQKNIPRTAILLTLASLAGMGAPIFSLFLSEFMVIAGAISFNYGLAVGWWLWGVCFFVLEENNILVTNVKTEIELLILQNTTCDTKKGQTNL